MADLGFWRLAGRDPARLAVVEPDGGEISAGELHAASNRLVHGLRALGLQKGDAIATVLPNGAAMLELFLAATQAGWYITPINHHLAGPEIAYIVDDCDAKALIGHERFAGELARAAKEIRLGPEGRFAVGRVEGFRPYAELSDGQPDTTPPDRTVGA